MGFMDKANKLAGQAQAKIDEAMQQVGERLSGDSADQGPPVDYDPVAPAPPAEEPDMSEKLAQLQQLGQLKAQGILTDAEFEAQKQRILSS